MKTVNIFDDVEKRYHTLTLTEAHLLPGEGDLLAFEAQYPPAKDFHEDRLRLNDFKVVTHKGFVVGVRTVMRAPRAIYANIGELFDAMFKQFAEVVEAHPGELNPHPLVYVIPPGAPGAGSVVVRNIAELRSGGLGTPSGSFVEREALSRRGARVAMQALGWRLRDE